MYPQGNQHSALAKAVPPSQQRCHMFGIDCATWQGGEMPSGLFFTPMSPAAGGARAKPLPLALHPVCTQILLLMPLFPKSRTKMSHIRVSGQPIKQLLVSCESAQLHSAPCSFTPGVAPYGASCLQKPAPRPDPSSWQNMRSVPWVCSRHWAWPWHPGPCSGSCLVLRGFLGRG